MNHLVSTHTQRKVLVATPPISTRSVVPPRHPFMDKTCRACCYLTKVGHFTMVHPSNKTMNSAALVRGENIKNKQYWTLEVATRLQTLAKCASFLNSSITLRVETVSARLTSPMHTYSSVQFEPHVNLETLLVNVNLESPSV